MSEQPKFEIQKWVDQKVLPNIIPLLPKLSDAPGVVVALRSAVLNNPKLMDAIAKDPNTALLQVVKCTRLGLSLDPGLEHFALIPYKGVVQGQVMVRGWTHLMLQSQRVEYIEADVIYRQEYNKDKPLRDIYTGKVNHVAHDLERDDYADDDIVAAYAMAKLTGSSRVISVVLTRKEIEKRRALGAGDTPSWRNWYKRMCCVKALKALARTGMVPLTREAIGAAAEPDDDALPPATPGPKQVTVDTSFSAVAEIAAEQTPGEDSAARYLFECRQKDPLPTPEKAREELIEALRLLRDEAGVDLDPEDQKQTAKELEARIERLRAWMRQH